MSNKTSKAGQSPNGDMPKININYKPVATKHRINPKKLLKKFIAKPLAYVTVLVLAAYGMHQVLRTLNDTAATVLTVLAVMALTYIMFDEA